MKIPFGTSSQSTFPSGRLVRSSALQRGVQLEHVYCRSMGLALRCFDVLFVLPEHAVCVIYNNKLGAFLSGVLL